MHPLLRRIAPVTLVLLAGCASWSSVRFVPSPLEVAVAPDPGAAALGRAVLSWRGIRRPSSESGYVARFRARIENEGKGPLVLEPERCELLDGSLVPFGPARVAPADTGRPDPLTIPAGGVGVYDLAFAFPGDGQPGGRDLSALVLRIGLRDESGGINVSATFDRLVYDRSYWGGSVWYADGWYPHYHHRHPGGGLTVSVGTAVRF